jgi:hypothetical protein
MKGKFIWIAAAIVAAYLFIPKIKDIVDKMFSWGIYKAGIPQAKVFESSKIPTKPVAYTGTVYTGSSVGTENSAS